MSSEAWDAGRGAAFLGRVDVACFATGVGIATPAGHRPVESLRAGDRVLTRDNGVREIAWVGAKRLHWAQLQRWPHLQPVLIRAGALENGSPSQDLLVSPEHRIVLRTIEEGAAEDVLVAARDLVGNPGISVVESMGMSYHHLMFEEHQVVLSNGSWSESFQPTDFSLAAVGNRARMEILGLFPELESASGVKGYKTALPSAATGAVVRFN